MLSTQKNSCSRQPKGLWLPFSFLAMFVGLLSAQPASASNITVASPVNNAQTTSPMWVRAHNVGCHGLTPTAFGFSIDSSRTTIMSASPRDIDFTQQSIGSGSHTIHFKAWTSHGICPVVNTTVNIGTGGSTGTPGGSGGPPPGGGGTVSIPSSAIAASDLDTSSSWQGEHDSGTPGSSRGSMLYPATTPSNDEGREFYMEYSSRGGERWHLSFARDAAATHFVMDTYFYVVNPSELANLELDLNQVMPNGKTVIYGTQCSTYSGTWEWTYYANHGFHWHPSNVPCKTTDWAANTWHHIQVGFHRDDNGYVTHDWVNFDGVHSDFSGAGGEAAESLGWATGSLIMNVQLDGYNKSGGSVKSYIHKTTFYRW